MSLASILRTRFPSTIPTLSSWTLRPIQRVVGWGGTDGNKLLSSPQIRRSGVWLEVIRQVPSEDPNRAGQLTFEDPDLADMRVNRVMRAEAPLRKRPNFVRHEKKWMRRKRLKMERRYLRLEEGVNELKAYIKFKQDNKPNW